jgi:hypothetical protein
MNREEMIDAISDADVNGVKTTTGVVFSSVLDDILEDRAEEWEYISDLPDHILSALISQLPDLTEEAAEDEIDFDIEDDEIDFDIEEDEDEMFDEEITETAFEDEDDEAAYISHLFDGFLYANKGSEFVPEFVTEGDITSEGITKWATDVLANEEDLITAAGLFRLPVGEVEGNMKQYFGDVIKYASELAEMFTDNLDQFQEAEPAPAAEETEEPVEGEEEPVEGEEVEAEPEAEFEEEPLDEF